MRKKPDDQRQFAARCVLNIRNGFGSSRKELSEEMEMSPSTAGLYVDQLIDAGYVYESGLKHGVMGRPKRRLEVRADAGWFVGVEWNANRVSAVRLDFAGNRDGSEERVLRAGVGMEEVLRVIEDAVVAVSKGVSGRFLGLGLGAPGVVDPEEGTAGDYPFIGGWHGVPLKERLEARFLLPVTVGNNLRVIAMAERWFGGARGMEDFVILGPRSGFGAAVVHRGQILGGVNHAAGEVGNWGWVERGEERAVELHEVLSAPAVWRRLTGAEAGAALPEDLRAEIALIAARQDGCWREVAGDFAKVVGFLHLLLDTQAFFVHGPLCGLGKGFWEEVVERAEKRMPRLATRPPDVRVSSLMDDAGALGAASLAMEAWEPMF